MQLRSFALRGLRGLAAMHATGKAHADVKPNNILLMGADEHGAPDLRSALLADFDMVVSTGERSYGYNAYSLKGLASSTPHRSSWQANAVSPPSHLLAKPSCAFATFVIVVRCSVTVARLCACHIRNPTEQRQCWRCP